MFWNVTSLVGTMVTIVCAIFSLVAWIHTKKYYTNIIFIEDVEKIDIAISDIKSSQVEYNNILRVFGNDRGVNVETVIKKFVNLKTYLQNIENELPQRFEAIQMLCEEPIKYIDCIIGGKNECKNSKDYELLQSEINGIHQMLKSKKDELRDIK